MSGTVSSPPIWHACCKLHVVKHMPCLRQRRSRPLRTPWMRCVVGTQEATRRRSPRARTTYLLAHRHTVPVTCTRSAASSLRPPRIGARTGRAVARAGAGRNVGPLSNATGQVARSRQRGLHRGRGADGGSDAARARRDAATGGARVRL